MVEKNHEKASSDKYQFLLIGDHQTLVNINENCKSNNKNRNFLVSIYKPIPPKISSQNKYCLISEFLKVLKHYHTVYNTKLTGTWYPISPVFSSKNLGSGSSKHHRRKKVNRSVAIKRQLLRI